MSNGLSEQARAAAAAVDGERLWSRLMAMAAIGARADGGVCRQALTREDRDARAVLTGWARARGLRVSVDAAANLFVTRPGARDLPPLLIGSHMDSQPAGGRFDGIYGVLAAFEVLEALEDAGLGTGRPIEMVAWTNEEGGRFPCGCTGSMSWSGEAPLENFLDVVGADGVVLRDALAETLAASPDIERRGLGGGAHAYIEAHIEQGPVLEREGLAIAAVTSIQGFRMSHVTVTGTPGHAGTTPMAARRDAVQGALRAIAALNELMADPSDTVRFTVGCIDVEPNSPNTIPARARFSIDFRHPEEAVLEARYARIEAAVRAAAAPCDADLEHESSMSPGVFPAPVVAAIEAAARDLGLPAMRLPSGAFHDALFIARACPAGMLFIPCKAGLSHHPDEYATPQDCEAGARVLAATAMQLAEATLS
jgi:N-carbamoyl-L-amino-acid hydrolase